MIKVTHKVMRLGKWDDDIRNKFSKLSKVTFWWKFFYAQNTLKHSRLLLNQHGKSSKEVGITLELSEKKKTNYFSSAQVVDSIVTI